MLKLLKVFGLVSLVVLVTSAEAFAADASVFSTIITKGTDLFKEIRTVVFVMGGFGLVGLAVASIFGRPMWKWFALLALGLVVVAVANAVINYFTTTEGTGTADTRVKLDDTITGT